MTSQTTQQPSGRIVRKAVLPADGDSILEIFSAAKAIMRAAGNANQWADGYPSLDVVRSDIEKGGAFVVVDDGTIVAYFAFIASPEPTYARIYNGNWIDDAAPYYVVHRIASRRGAHHVFADMLDYCFAHCDNLRIDTHRDNTIMQHNLDKHGFAYCGIIYLASGDERLAYQRIL